MTAVAVRVRSAALDRFRGLAIALMLLDHLVLFFHGPDLIRHTVTRLAMPMFFLLAGHLASRLSVRHVWVGVAGLVLPALVWWIDTPNVLLLWSLGSLLMWLGAGAGVPWWLVPAVALTVAANGWADPVGGYDVAAVLGLMGLGSQLRRESFAWAGCLPAVLEAVGRHPLGWYLGHLAVLQCSVLLGALR